ncbi:glycosyltransferase family 4 protein [Candidatus Electronema sp. PJ]|uniref:glycosyltransferase family 4 protein n=1 Tax=Candidatus Electronema sp. PJ TaxID=3401572 RepID=UPI003AA909CD
MISSPVKVHLCGSENNGWALDTDLALTKRSLQQLSGLVQLTSFEEADVIHSVWEEPLFQLDQKRLSGKRIICHVCNNLMRLYENPAMIKAGDMVGLWVAMSQEAVRDLHLLGYRHAYVPYSVDTDIFHPQPLSKTAVRNRYGISESVLLISNFMRDSFGHDLTLPKDQKGAELLLELGIHLQKKQIPVHFLLAGPRRHWIRSQFRRFSIPFTFIGKETKQDDDLTSNIAPAEVVSDLYNASDLHLVTSRWEGGPRSVLEAAATKTPILCTPVGIAPDILLPESLYSSFDEAAAKIEAHYHHRNLEATVEPHYQAVLARHTPECNVPLFEKLYRQIDEVKPFVISEKWTEKAIAPNNLKKRIAVQLQRLTGRYASSEKLSISLWHEFHKPPYGGGNQFMLALQDEMEKQGVKTETNKLSSSIDVHICNSCWFDYKKFQQKAGSFPIRMIHRIDGPVTLYRGEGRMEDEKIFTLNRQLASATVFQSAYSFRQCSELGFRAVAPVIIHNSVNRAIFNPDGRLPFEQGRKIRLVSSAWSDNPRKGGPLMKWLDEHLDWSRFEYTFIGRVQEKFEHIKHIQAVPSEELAQLLRQQDIYLALSLHEPCSNALLEALACGLPVLYRDDGGNPELVSFAGLPFTNENDILEQLERLANNVVSFQRLIWTRNMADIAARYIALAKKIRDWHRILPGNT